MSEIRPQNTPAVYTSDGNTWTVTNSSSFGGYYDTAGEWVPETNDNIIWTTDNSWSTGTTITTTWPVLDEVLPEEIRDKKFVGYLFIDDDQHICLYDSKNKKTIKIIDLKEGKELTTLMNVIAKMLLSNQD